MFWQELLNMLHESLGPCLSNFSAVPMPGHTPHWCEFWPWQADLASWLDFRPTSSLQACLAILTLGWSQLLCLDLPCSCCCGTMGLCWWDLCPACFAAVLSSWLSFPYREVHSFCLYDQLFVSSKGTNSLNPLTLISLIVVTWQRQTWWCPVVSLCRIQICVFDSQSPYSTT